MTARRPDLQVNRAYWEGYGDEYQQEHGRMLARRPDAWGVWRIPEAELDVLGDVTGLDLLELGCGGGQWSVEVAGWKGRPVGLDLSRAQLSHAAALARRRKEAVPLVEAGAEVLPFRDGSFDIVFCDHGAMTFADPLVVLPEVTRVLRPGGRFAFCIASPWLLACIDPETDEVTDSLHAGYFGMHRFSWDEVGVVEYQLPYPDWLRLFRECGLVVDDLLQLRPPKRAKTTYDMVPYEWARRWPAEDLWKLRKPA